MRADQGMSSTKPALERCHQLDRIRQLASQREFVVTNTILSRRVSDKDGMTKTHSQVKSRNSGREFRLNNKQQSSTSLQIVPTHQTMSMRVGLNLINNII